jgi:tetratricopeptide (TPR) repeat protein
LPPEFGTRYNSGSTLSTMGSSPPRLAALALVGLLLSPSAADARQTLAPSEDPDRLYDRREDLTSAERAASIWAARLAEDPRNFEAAWKLARAAYWLGAHVPEARRRSEYERGLAAGRQATAIEPKRPEGRFWLAATMGAMAESLGLATGIRYRGAVKRELEAVLAIDAAYLDGAADRALGRWYFRVPRLFGGSRARAIEHLRRSLEYDPLNAASHFFLAEAYIAIDRPAEARQHLQQVLGARETVEWGPEVREFKRRARPLLAAASPP